MQGKRANARVIGIKKGGATREKKKTLAVMRQLASDSEEGGGKIFRYVSSARCSSAQERKRSAPVI